MQMSLRCEVCNDMLKIKEQKFGLVDRRYCSVRCRIIGLRVPTLVLGLAFLGIYFGISLPFNYSDKDLWSIFIFMFPIIIAGLTFLGISVAGFVSKARKNQELAQK